MELISKPGVNPIWVFAIDGIRAYLDDRDGEPDPAQLAAAEFVANDLSETRRKASDYLDVFVDRRHASKRVDEPWWFEEMDFRASENSPSAYSLHFTLDGDGDGLWTVEMRLTGATHRPFRFERLQG